MNTTLSKYIIDRIPFPNLTKYFSIFPPSFPPIVLYIFPEISPILPQECQHIHYSFAFHNSSTTPSPTHHPRKTHKSHPQHDQCFTMRHTTYSISNAGLNVQMKTRTMPFGLPRNMSQQPNHSRAFIFGSRIPESTSKPLWNTFGIFLSNLHKPMSDTGYTQMGLPYSSQRYPQMIDITQPTSRWRY